MDNLRLLSRSTFDQHQQFSDEPPGAKFHVFEIQGGGSTCNRKVAQSDLGDWARDQTEATTESASATTLGLVCVHRKLDVKLEISKSTFQAVLDAMRVDEAALYMVNRDYDGFHEFMGGSKIESTNPSNSAGGSSGGEGVTKTLPTWFLGTSLYALLWTFDQQTSHTLAIFFNRRRESFPAFTKVLTQFSTCAHSSHLLCFATCVHQLHTFDEESSGFGLQTIRDVEGATGYQPHADAFHDPIQRNLELPTFDIKKVTKWSRLVGIVAGDTANKMRHQAVCRRMLSEIRRLARVARKSAARRRRGGEGSGGAAVPLDPRQQMREKSILTLAEAVPVIERHMATYAEYLAYLKYRAERLSDVLFVLLTHEDATASVGHAAASVRLADATRRESLSMKTIAIMTMIFLPGTFFSSLFAIPTLDWEASEVMRARFWVYWAFTIPSTLFVFIVWLIWTEWDWIVSIYGRDSRRASKKMHV